MMLRYVNRDRIGEILVLGPNDEKIFEGNLRQCVHCQYTWTYRPGSGDSRGFCMRCNGHLCGKAPCYDCYPAEQRVEDIERQGRILTVGQWAAIDRMDRFRESAYHYAVKKRRFEAALALQRRRESLGVTV